MNNIINLDNNIIITPTQFTRLIAAGSEDQEATGISGYGYKTHCLTNTAKVKIKPERLVEDFGGPPDFGSDPAVSLYTFVDSTVWVGRSSYFNTDVEAFMCFISVLGYTYKKSLI